MAAHRRRLFAPRISHVDAGQPDVIPGNNEFTAEEASSRGLTSYEVPSSYMREAKNANGIRFCSGEDYHHHHTHTTSNDTRHHMPLEFNAVDPRAEHLADFIQDLGPSLSRGYLLNRYSYTGTPLFEDFYGQAVVVISDYEQPGWLFLLDIINKARRIDALWRLCTRTAPKFWPSLYAGAFEPSRIRRIREERTEIAVTLRAELDRLDAEAQQEEEFFGPYYNLLYIGDRALVELVTRLFREVLACEVSDLDDQVAAEDWRTLDLRLARQGWSAFIEVRGSTNRNARVDDLERLDDHCETAAGRYGSATSKLLVFNGRYGRPEEERLRDSTFSSLVIEEATTRGITLVDTRGLLQAIDRIRCGDLSVEDCVSILGRPGMAAFGATEAVSR